MLKYQIKKTSDGQFRWTLETSEGASLLTSESYTTKQACLAGAESSKKCLDEKNFAKETSKKEQPYFNQVANNHQVLGVSKMYSSSHERDADIKTIREHASTAATEDETA